MVCAKDATHRSPPSLRLRVSVRTNHCLRGDPILRARQVFSRSHRDAEKHEKEKNAAGATDGDRPHILVQLDQVLPGTDAPGNWPIDSRHCTSLQTPANSY